MNAEKLRAPKDLSDEELSQELYNCAAFLTSACDAEEPPEDGTEPAGNIELMALLLQRAVMLVEECAGESLGAVASKATDEDREVLAGTDARIKVPEDEPA